MVLSFGTTATAQRGRDARGHGKSRKRKAHTVNDDNRGVHFHTPNETIVTTHDQPPPPYESLQHNDLAPFGQAYLNQPQMNTRLPTTQTNGSTWNLAPGQNNHAWQSSPQLPTSVIPHTNEDCPVARGLNQGAAFFDQVAARLSDAINRFDGEVAHRDELDRALEEMVVEDETEARDRGLRRDAGSETLQGTPRSGLVNFKKTWKYANSKLPPHLPPLKVYMPTWRIICMAARASQEAYVRPQGDERQDYIDASWRNGTKAMVLKSKPIDDQNLIVLAIRGSQKNFIDWAVNFRPAPTAPVGMLDDQGNACHAGFLSVARATIGPIAARLRSLLEQNPSRASSSLLLTGHSAGGAVAALLYMHMLSTTMETELNILTGCFKRVHCVTFGAPPVTLLPLQKPAGRKFEKSVFMSFANEGDPVVRADKAYVLSLAKLLTAPMPPSLPPTKTPENSHKLVSKFSRPKLKSKSTSNILATSQHTLPPYWPVPPATLSCAGRLILLRERHDKYRTVHVEALSTTDEQLRDVVFGDPATHMMALYRQRVETLAVSAVTGKA